LDKPLHVIYKVRKSAYRIWVILIANKRIKKNIIFLRVEAGKNTSTVMPASRNRRRKGNPVVSGETVPAYLREG
jgi:hypothetical protein